MKREMREKRTALIPCSIIIFVPIEHSLHCVFFLQCHLFLPLLPLTVWRCVLVPITPLLLLVHIIMDKIKNLFRVNSTIWAIINYLSTMVLKHKSLSTMIIFSLCQTPPLYFAVDIQLATTVSNFHIPFVIIVLLYLLRSSHYRKVGIWDLVWSVLYHTVLILFPLFVQLTTPCCHGDWIAMASAALHPPQVVTMVVDKTSNATLLDTSLMYASLCG